MAPAPTKTPSQAASSAGAARSQRRSVRATSSRRGPLPPVGTGARIAEAAGLGPGALTLAPGGGYRPLRGALLHSFDEALDFADGFASSWLGVVLELNNAWIERRLYENIRRRTGRIAVVQVSDF